MGDLILPSQQNNQLGMYDDKVFDSMAVASGKYLPRVSIMGTNAKLVAENKIRAGNYAFMKGSDSFIDLTAEFSALILAWRPLFMKIDGDTIISEYDPSSDLAKKIQTESEVQDSGCMWGPDFLVAIPNHGMATYFANSKTARREAQNAMPILKGTRMATFRSHLIATLKYRWWGPLIGVCTVKENFINMPDQETVDAEFAKFINPPKQEAELAKDSPGRER